MNYSFGLLKPDCIKRGIEKEVLVEIFAIGLKVINTKLVRLTKKEVDIIWASCKKEKFYEELVKFSTSGDCIVFIVKGKKAIKRLNELVGHYEPAQAGRNTIRHRFGTSAMENVIHSSLDSKMFRKEALLFFTESELNLLIT